MAGPLIPIIMTGARIVIKKAPDIARALIKAGKARYAKNVSRDIDEAVTRIAGKGKGAPKLDLPSAARRAAAKKKATTATPKKATTATPKKAPKLDLPGAARRKAATTPKKVTATKTKRPGSALIPATGPGRSLVPTGKWSSTTTRITPKKRGKIPAGIKAAGVVGGVIGAASLLDSGGTKSVTVKSGDTLSQIAKDNNTTIAAIKKANPSITNIHLIRAGQTIKVPKVKDRKSVYQGMTSAELQQPKKTTTATKIKYGPPGSYGASKSGGMVKRKSGGKVKKYTGGGPLKGVKQMTTITVKPPPTKKNPWGAAIKGRGKGYKKNAF